MECKIKIKYGAIDSKYYTDDCEFSRYNEFSNTGPNIWWGSVDGCKILITQNGREEIKEENIRYEPKSGSTNTGIITQKWEIVKAFNDFNAEVHR